MAEYALSGCTKVTSAGSRLVGSVVRILKFDDPIRKISVVSESDPDPKPPSYQSPVTITLLCHNLEIVCTH